MEDVKKLFKEDINFLEYPNWVIDKKSKITLWSVQKENGRYEISSPHGIPTHFDKLVLYFLLHKLPELESSALKVKTSCYEIARGIFPQKKITGSYKFTRIMQSLKKWKAISIIFEGVFFEKNNYIIRGFSIIDEFLLDKETNELFVQFNAAYIKQKNESKFYKLIDFNQYKSLRGALAARLYELLIKNFKEREEWVINFQGLSKKLTFEMRHGSHNYYSSDIIDAIAKAVKEINACTETQISFSYNKKNSSCVFKKAKKNKNMVKPAVIARDQSHPRFTTAKQVVACYNFFNALPDGEKNEIMEQIKRQPFLEFLPDPKERIYVYMVNSKKWQFA